MIIFTDNPPTQKVAKPTVKHIFTKERGFLPYQVNNFECVFPFLTSLDPSKPFLYQVYWYIDGVLVYATEPIRKENFSETFLNEKHGLVKMDITVIHLFNTV